MNDPVTETESTSLPPTGATVAGNRGEAEVIEYSRARQTVTRRIAEAKATIPHIYLQLRVDMDAAETFREELADRPGGGSAPTVTDLVIRAAALALAEHPRANAGYRDGTLRLHSKINIGFAVDTDDGSVTPVIVDADRKSLAEISILRGDLTDRTLSGELTPPERSGATFAVSSLGILGVTGSQPVVDPGHSAKLSVGAITEEPVVRDGRIVPGRRMELNLSCDHRALHGGEAARFLTAVGRRLESPEELQQ